MASTIYLETGSTDPRYNLAFEEYVLRNYTQGDILILWQNANAVIVGRNQNAEAEINKAFVAEHDILVVRRNTGGGTVYHDMGNLNYSFITDVDGLERDTLHRFLEPVVKALQGLGLEAEASGRNDILVSGKKVSGTAQQLLNGRILHHGTLLFNANTSVLAGALNPDPTKFQSKGISSVRSRVGNIRDHLGGNMDMAVFWQYLKGALLAGETVQVQLKPEDLRAIETLKAEKYDTWEWNFGRSPKYQFTNKKRWPGGLLEVHLSVEAGKISGLRIFGDFLSLRPVPELEETLTGCSYQEEAILDALKDVPLQGYLGCITPEELVATIMNQT